VVVTDLAQATPVISTAASRMEMTNFFISLLLFCEKPLLI
jgi:hypothetical protein